MNSRQNINRMAGLLVAAVAAFFVIMIANQAVAEEYMDAIKGQIASVDSYNRTLSVTGPAGEVTFSIDKSTNLVLCGMNKTFEDLGRGQKVEVKYHEEYGRLIADSVDIAPVFLACYDE